MIRDLEAMNFELLLVMGPMNMDEPSQFICYRFYPAFNCEVMRVEGNVATSLRSSSMDPRNPTTAEMRAVMEKVMEFQEIFARIFWYSWSERGKDRMGEDFGFGFDF